MGAVVIAVRREPRHGLAVRSEGAGRVGEQSGDLREAVLVTEDVGWHSQREFWMLEERVVGVAVAVCYPFKPSGVAAARRQGGAARQVDRPAQLVVLTVVGGVAGGDRNCSWAPVADAMVSAVMARTVASTTWTVNSSCGR